LGTLPLWMDYSILVSVRCTGNDGAVPAMRQDSHLTPALRAQSPRPERRNGRESNPPGEVRPHCHRSTVQGTPVNNDLGDASLSRTHGTMASLTAAHGPMGSTSRYHAGLAAMLGGDTCYIAIIDALTLYNGKKLSANFQGDLPVEAPTLSIIEPDAYRARITKYSRLISRPRTTTGRRYSSYTTSCKQVGCRRRPARTGESNSTTHATKTCERLETVLNFPLPLLLSELCHTSTKSCVEHALSRVVR
jgi:hypothetical protein